LKVPRRRFREKTMKRVRKTRPGLPVSGSTVKRCWERPMADGQSGDDHKREVGGRGRPGPSRQSGEDDGVPREDIVRSTGHRSMPAGEKKAEDRDKRSMPKGRPADVRDGI